MAKDFSVSPAQALTDYLALGPTRSIRALALAYKNSPDVPVPPSTTLIGTWSRKHRWRAKASIHDGKVEARVAAVLLDDEVGDRVAIARTFLSTATKALRVANDRLDRRIDLAKTPADVATLVKVAIEAATKADVLTGGVSDRTERRDAPAPDAAPIFDVTPIQDAIDRHEARKTAPPPTTKGDKPVH